MRGTSWRRYAGSIVLALTLALPGCSGDEGPNLAGTWTGTIQDSVAVAATRDEDNNNHFTGTYASFNCALTESGSLDVRR